MTVASSKLRLFRRSMPHIPLRYMWGFQQFTLLRSVSAYAGMGRWEAHGYLRDDAGYRIFRDPLMRVIRANGSIYRSTPELLFRDIFGAGNYFVGNMAGGLEFFWYFWRQNNNYNI